ncbi:MAG: HDIG domain-containing metalloprotein [Acidimicrobiia bacterium]
MHRLQVEASFLTHGSWPHLASRFVRSLGSKPLSSAEEATVRNWLLGEEGAAFFDQPATDQRHGYQSASHVAQHFPERRDLIRAALLHDLGKRHSQLNVIGRSLITGLAKVGLRRLFESKGGRADLYLRHGELAADELSDLGTEPLVVAFARSHHADRPIEIEASSWEILVAADR